MSSANADSKPGGPSLGLRALALAGSILLCFSAALLGAVFMSGEWYATLRKPSWNSPGSHADRRQAVLKRILQMILDYRFEPFKLMASEMIPRISSTLRMVKKR